MKNQSQQSITPTVTSMYNNSTSLYSLVKKLQLSLLPKATLRKSFIINDIDKSLTVCGEENILAYVIGSLLVHSIYSSKASCIRVETVSVENQLQIKIRNKSKSSFTYSSYEHIIGGFANDAKKLGGSIGLEAEENSGVTLVFSMARNAA
jgi:hypothetical protein